MKPGLYRNELELDGSGNLIGITAEGQKNSFFALSMRVGENPDFAMIISEASADPSEFDDQLEEKYPQVESGDFDFTSLNGWSEEFLDEWNVNPADSDDKEDEDDWDDEEDDEEEDEEDDEEDEEKPASARDSDKPRDPRFPPIPANARVWSVNFTAPFDEYVFAFITEDYPFLLNNGKVSLNSKARDISRRALKFGQLKMNVPMMESVTIE